MADYYISGGYNPICCKLNAAGALQWSYTDANAWADGRKLDVYGSSVYLPYGGNPKTFSLRKLTAAGGVSEATYALAGSMGSTTNFGFDVGIDAGKVFLPTHRATSPNQTCARLTHSLTEEAIYDAGANSAAVALEGTDYVYLGGDRTSSITLRKLNYADFGAVATFDTGDAIRGICLQGGKLYIGHSRSGSKNIRRLTTALLEEYSFDTSTGSAYVWARNTRAYASHTRSSSISVRSFTLEFSVVATFDLASNGNSLHLGEDDTVIVGHGVTAAPAASHTMLSAALVQQWRYLGPPNSGFAGVASPGRALTVYTDTEPAGTGTLASQAATFAGTGSKLTRGHYHLPAALASAFVAGNAGALLKFSNVVKYMVPWLGTGAAFPTAEIATGKVASGGEAFVFEPTGRKVLYVYNAAGTPVPVLLLDDATLYVDPASGSDAIAKGTATGASAYASLLYAIQQLPRDLGGHEVTVYCAAGDVGACEIADFSNGQITIIGTLATEVGIDADAGCTQGTGATRGAVIDQTGGHTPNEYQHMWLWFDASAANAQAVRLIQSHTADTFTVFGTWPDAVPAEDDYANIYSLATQISTTLNVLRTSVPVSIQRMEIAAIDMSRGASLSLEIVEVAGRIVVEGAHVELETCCAQASDTVLDVNRGGADLYRSYLKETGVGGGCVWVTHGDVLIDAGTTLDDGTNVVSAFTGGQVQFNNVAASGYCFVENGTSFGVFASQGGKAFGVTNNQYSGNGTDESATAAHYSVIA
jgi:hypothetical protein